MAANLIAFRFRELVFTTQNYSFGMPFISDGIFSSKFSNEFVVSKLKGVGGFGCVVEAVNKYDNWKYAVKRVSVDARDINMALREVRAMAQLDHPNIVRYNSTWIEAPPQGWQHDADAELLKQLGSSERFLANFKSDSVFIYIQMQLCKHSLSDWLEHNEDPASRDIPRLKSWLKQMLSAVCYIHSKNLIHRDLKPSNILFAEQDHLKLCDLGIVTERIYNDEFDTDITRTSIGTMLYMSPEQVRHLE
ncbi:hypothetical protein PMAYCL1PPCAC_08442 [Pristionchus mayeri]|uniref:Protein kinase domain-containing protein n=1 Tax=Pristionchus mayeri TaxID=1317129 RepID=A0AAN4ZHR5_9BILA|nr:hypothetical protein PMAYCL1PPCAC_08442 [Pristionchus mayeri]